MWRLVLDDEDEGFVCHLSNENLSLIRGQIIRDQIICMIFDEDSAPEIELVWQLSLLDEVSDEKLEDILNTVCLLFPQVQLTG